MASHARCHFGGALVLREARVVLLWIAVTAVCLWALDAIGMLSRDMATQPLVVDVPEAHQFWEEGRAVFVDGRSADDFDRGHIPGAKNVTIGTIDEGVATLPQDKSAHLIVYCSSAECPVGYLILRKLQQHGYTQLQLFERGIDGWRRFGYPLQKTAASGLP